MIKPVVVRIRASSIYRNERVLPAEGDILVRLGDNVRPETPIARVHLSTAPINVPAATTLGVRPRDLAAHLIKQVGDQVHMGDIIARRKATLFKGKRDCAAPTDGTVEYISYDTGDITIRRPVRTTTLHAESIGRVTQIVSGRSVVVETNAALIQGAFGTGEEAFGQLKLMVSSPAGTISPGQIDKSCEGSVLVVGNVDDDAVFTRAAAVGVRGLILGGIRVAGREKWPILSKAAPITTIITDGFGSRGIFAPAFHILRENDERRVWLRPSLGGRAEIVIPLSEEIFREAPNSPSLSVGARVRITRAPFAGLAGHIHSLPTSPGTLESGLIALVAEVDLEEKRRVTVPIANLELIG